MAVEASENRFCPSVEKQSLEIYDLRTVRVLYIMGGSLLPLDSLLLLGAVEGKLKHMWNFTWTLLLFEVFLLELKAR